MRKIRVHIQYLFPRELEQKELKYTFKKLFWWVVTVTSSAINLLLEGQLGKNSEPGWCVWVIHTFFSFHFHSFRSTRRRTNPLKSEDASWFLSSTTPRSPAWSSASSAALTSPPWTPTASPTPMSKRQYKEKKHSYLSTYLSEVGKMDEPSFGEIWGNSSFRRTYIWVANIKYRNIYINQPSSGYLASGPAGPAGLDLSLCFN